MSKVLIKNQIRILNCIPSKDAHLVAIHPATLAAGPIKESVDYRDFNWPIKNQGETGSCVGHGTATVLEYHLTKLGKTEPYEKMSPRFIWTASKETDEYSEYPETMIESAGTFLTAALNVIQKYGAVSEARLPLTGPRFGGSTEQFYMEAAKNKILGYVRIPSTPLAFKEWLSNQGPILMALQVNEEFIRCHKNHSILRDTNTSNSLGGHCVCCTGYLDKGFILQNSWDTTWGDNGCAYMTNEYLERVISEAYGIYVN